MKLVSKFTKRWNYMFEYDQDNHILKIWKGDGPNSLLQSIQSQLIGMFKPTHRRATAGQSEPRTFPLWDNNVNHADFKYLIHTNVTAQSVLEKQRFYCDKKSPLCPGNINYVSRYILYSYKLWALYRTDDKNGEKVYKLAPMFIFIHIFW